jgi:potassium voltage-gated channel Eag-related subfamily H protein 8
LKINNLQTTPGEKDKYTNMQKLVIICYYAITTLSTVGYGDLFPISNYEKIIGIIYMFGGVGFFSWIMGNFIEIISNFSDNLR